MRTPRPRPRRRAGAASMPRPSPSASRGARSGGGGSASKGGAKKPVKRGNGSVRNSKSTPRARTTERRASERIVQAGRTTTVDATAGMSRGKYVYCIIESGDPLRFGPIGIGADPSDVYTVHFKNLAAVVSDAPLEVLDSTRENVLAHERVNETVMREHTVIPMSFGTIFKTREDIVELLRSAAEAFGDVLNKMQNKL